MILPQTDRERGRTPDARSAPQTWSAEVARYFRLLAEQARKERQRQQAREASGGGE